MFTSCPLFTHQVPRTNFLAAVSKSSLLLVRPSKPQDGFLPTLGERQNVRIFTPPPKKKKGPTQLCDIQWNTWDWLWLQHPGDFYVKPIKLIWKFGFELLDLIKCHKDALPESRSAIITHLEVGEEGSTLEVCFMFRIYSITSIKEVYYPYPTTNDTKWQPENSQQVNNQRIS